MEFQSNKLLSKMILNLICQNLEIEKVTDKQFQSNLQWLLCSIGNIWIQTQTMEMTK